MYIYTFLLRMTDTMTYLIIDTSSWDILYVVFYALHAGLKTCPSFVWFNDNIRLFTVLKGGRQYIFKGQFNLIRK
jgi:hypothetical protein